MRPHLKKLLPTLVLAALAQFAIADDAATTPAPAADNASTQADAITVIGHRETRQVENVTQIELQEAPPGTSPLKVLEKLPGVEFTDSDPFGNYEWAERFTIRGFGQTYLGFTLDGIPLGDMSYGNNNGLHISRAISQENIRRETLAQGTGSLSTESTSNLGGTVEFFSDDPQAKFGIQAEVGGGSESSARVFTRLDTGTLPSGAMAYLSFTDQSSDKWKGVGTQKQQMVNFKLVQSIGTGRISLYGDHQERKEVDYQDMTMDMINKLGWNWDNYGNLQTAVNVTKGIYINPNVGNLNGVDPEDAAYGGSSGLRRDDLFGLAADFYANDNVRLKNTVYYHHDAGQGHYVTFTPTPDLVVGGVTTRAGSPLSVRTTDYTIGRAGDFGNLVWTLGINSIEAGFWFERSEHNATRNYHELYGDMISGSNEDLTWLSSNDVFKTLFNQQFVTTTKQVYLEDTIALFDDRGRLNFGFKSTDVDIQANESIPTNLPKSRAGGELDAKKVFLPQIGFNYQFAHGQELFASAAENMRAYQPGVDGIFSSSQADFDAIKSTVKPETSSTYDLGYRFKAERFSGVADVYYTDFRNRLLATAPCQAIQSCDTVFSNVGRVTNKGIELALDTKLTRDIIWFNSVGYNVSQYQSNYLDGGVVQVSGKNVVDAPRLMFTTNLGYDDGTWFAHVNEKYTDKRYYTYTNDESVPSFWLTNLDAGYKQARMGGLRDFRITLNVANATNLKYVSVLGTGGFQASGDTLETLQPGSPRAIFLSIGAKY